MACSPILLAIDSQTLQLQGFVTAVVNESIFVNDPRSGVKYWSPRGVPIITTYNENHDRIVAYGALTTDGRQFVRTYEEFDKETFLKYLKALVGHFDRIAVIMDNARSTGPESYGNT